ncbi:MAG: hypothetical protein QNJ90_09930 [Planctomycetota bacterium]|nr:hypothetical protein [Planctomycetota bacterium]
MFFGRVEEIDDTPSADHAEGEVIGDGVRIRRRQVLRFSAAAGAVALLARTGETREPPKVADPFAPLTFEKVVEQLRPLAGVLLTLDQPNEEAYLHTVAALLHRVQPIPASSGKSSRPMKMSALARHRPLVVYEIDLKPGAKIRLHDHHDYNGVIYGVEGAVEVRNFDIVTPQKKGRSPDRDKEFDIRETTRGLVTAGRVSSLSRRRENLHEVVAGKDGARLIDVFTFFSKEARSRYLEFDDKPHGKDKRLYRAAYKR